MGIRVGIITDIPITKTPEEEREEILLELSNMGLEISSVVAGFDVLEVLESRPDLLIVDYGGMSTSGAGDGAAYNIRHICNWASEHPGRLVVLWTYFTGALYGSEMEAQFGDAGNIVYPSDYLKFGIEDKIKSWFGGGN